MINLFNHKSQEDKRENIWKFSNEIECIKVWCYQFVKSAFDRMHELIQWKIFFKFFIIPVKYTPPTLFSLSHYSQLGIIDVVNT